MAFNLTIEPEAKARGTILLPPGVRREAGVSLKLDGSPFGGRLSYADCRPPACVVPLVLDRGAVKLLENRKSLSIDLDRDAGGAPAVFTVALDGFAWAANRSVELTAQ